MVKMSIKSEIEKAMKHPNILGAGARKREKLPCNLKGGVVMREFYRGTLHSGSGALVTDVTQAKAIASSETRRCKHKKKRR